MHCEEKVTVAVDGVLSCEAGGSCLVVGGGSWGLAERKRGRVREVQWSVGVGLHGRNGTVWDGMVQ